MLINYYFKIMFYTYKLVSVFQTLEIAFYRSKTLGLKYKYFNTRHTLAER